MFCSLGVEDQILSRRRNPEIPQTAPRQTPSRRTTRDGRTDKNSFEHTLCFFVFPQCFPSVSLVFPSCSLFFLAFPIYRGVLKIRRHARVWGILEGHLRDIWRTFGGFLEENCRKFGGRQGEIRRENLVFKILIFYILVFKTPLQLFLSFCSPFRRRHGAAGHLVIAGLGAAGCRAARLKQFPPGLEHFLSVLNLVGLWSGAGVTLDRKQS